jgi:hypothetical protein
VIDLSAHDRCVGGCDQPSRPFVGVASEAGRSLQRPRGREVATAARRVFGGDFELGGDCLVGAEAGARARAGLPGQAGPALPRALDARFGARSGSRADRRLTERAGGETESRHQTPIGAQPARRRLWHARRYPALLRRATPGPARRSHRRPRAARRSAPPRAGCAPAPEMRVAVPRRAAARRTSFPTHPRPRRATSEGARSTPRDYLLRPRSAGGACEARAPAHHTRR